MELFNHLTTGLNANERKWLLQWLAFPLQKPGTKFATAVVFWGAQTGTGKTMLGEIMGKIYGENYCSINERDLHSQFTQWAEKKQFILGDEITGGGERKRSVAEELKSMITQESVTINVKYKPEYKIRDVRNFYFTSNHEDAFFIEDRDRRYFVHAVIVGRLNDEFYRTLRLWKDSAEGPAALFYYLLNKVDISDFNPAAAAPATKAKIQMIADGRSDVESWLAQLKEYPQSVLGTDATLWTPKLLLEKYRSSSQTPTSLSPNTFGKKLRSAGFIQWGCRGPIGQGALVKHLVSRLWIVTSKAVEINVRCRNVTHRWAAQQCLIRMVRLQ
jgi:putative DNA primase/helicase